MKYVLLLGCGPFLFLFFCGCEQSSTPATKWPSRIVSDGSPISTSAVKLLIARLKDEEGDKAYRAAMEIATYKKKAIPLLVEGLQSWNANTRKWCARALTNIAANDDDQSARAYAEPAVPPLLAALRRERNEDVAWYMVQAIGTIHSSPQESVDVLRKILPQAGTQLQREIVHNLGEFKTQAISAKPVLITLLRKPYDDWLHGNIVTALAEIGITEPDAQELIAIKFHPASSAPVALLMELLKYPGPALSFLQQHPGIMQQEELEWQTEPLIKVLKDTTPETSQLRTYLRERTDLPALVMVDLGSPNFRPVIEARITNSCQHERTFLEACSRALGATADRIVEISESQAGDFKPKSAHPGTDPDRETNEIGHGDGITHVLITGTLRMTDGSAAVEPQFYDLNDRMLMGETRKDPAPLMRFDRQSGRFVLLTTVFAAYTMGEGQKEPGPYQTGSARMLIEAQGARSLAVTFYDEMPDVRITLSRRGENEIDDNPFKIPLPKIEKRPSIPKPVAP